MIARPDPKAPPAILRGTNLRWVLRSRHTVGSNFIGRAGPPKPGFLTPNPFPFLHTSLSAVSWARGEDAESLFYAEGF